MEQAQQTSGRIVFAIQRAGNHGFVCTLGESVQFDAATSTLPELFDWMAMEASKALGAVPYRQQMVLQAPPQPRMPAPPPPMPPVQSGYIPPPLPEGSEQDPPIPAGVMPEGTQSLMQQLDQRMRANGRVASVLPLLLCTLAYNLWPFGV